MSAVVLTGDCRVVLSRFPENYFDAVVCDPPYELGFMGKDWDGAGVSFQPETWKAALRVLKPGGHLLAFGGTRTYHRIAVAIEDAGFEIRDQIQWLYGSGFPKSMDVSKAIDKAAGKEREVIGKATGGGFKTKTIGTVGHKEGAPDITAPATSEAEQWQGWGTALKPAHEPIVLARKPFKGTVAANVLEHGTGALNIDGTRIGYEPGEVNFDRQQVQQNSGGTIDGAFGAASLIGSSIPTYKPEGRWPANLILGHHDDCEDACYPDCPVRMLDEQTGVLKSGTAVGRNKGIVASSNVRYSGDDPTQTKDVTYGDSGGASRFFYQAKASRKERNAGLETLKDGYLATMGDGIGMREHNPDQPTAWVKNNHPTVKPIALMRYLVRLVTPPDGRILDPFAGSGTTGVAAVLEGFNFVGIDSEPEYVAIAQARIKHWKGTLNG